MIVSQGKYFYFPYKSPHRNFDHGLYLSAIRSSEYLLRCTTTVRRIQSDTSANWINILYVCPFEIFIYIFTFFFDFVCALRLLFETRQHYLLNTGSYIFIYYYACEWCGFCAFACSSSIFLSYYFSTDDGIFLFSLFFFFHIRNVIQRGRGRRRV